MPRLVGEKMVLDQSRRALSAALEEARRLTKIGLRVRSKHYQMDTPPAKDARQAQAYAKIRLDAIRLIQEMCLGTKARGGTLTEGNGDGRKPPTLDELAAMPGRRREEMIRQALAEGDINQEQAAQIRLQVQKIKDEDSDEESPI